MEDTLLTEHNGFRIGDLVAVHGKGFFRLVELVDRSQQEGMGRSDNPLALVKSVATVFGDVNSYKKTRTFCTSLLVDADAYAEERVIALRGYIGKLEELLDNE